MAGNSNLRRASKVKNDEFYTQIIDIEKEIKHYKEQFENKVVFCNCDDPYESNFFKYFAMNFNHLKLKKLIATCYDSSPIAYTQLNFLGEEKTIPNKNRKAYKIEITEVKDFNNDGATDLTDVKTLLLNEKNALTMLKGDGDFRSEECVKLLKECDIVCTNPPFSLFREYVAQLIEHDKKFLIIGNKNAVTYKEIFSLFSKNRAWLGYRNINEDMWLIVPKEKACEKIVDGKRLKHIMACWFTNLPTTKRNEELILYKNYTPEEYPNYDNYNAINVDKVTDIPCDYYGYMGVPITFLDKYNPEQFELLGIMNTGEVNVGIRYENTAHGRPLVNGVEKYLRLIIRRKGNEN
ncbi:MAG: adenine-specific methyltransferase EcoRI family protein [Clostridia bacterium]|nr:adenine-specific methyltransferase EcoRI family protein [Clostridia bacterium]